MMECLQEQLTTFWQGTEYPSDFTAWKASKYGVLSGPYCPVSPSAVLLLFFFGYLQKPNSNILIP